MIKTSNFDQSLNNYYGDFGHTFKTKEAAFAELKARGYKLENNKWLKYGREAFIYRLFDISYFKQHAPKKVYTGYLVQFDGRNMISHHDCVLKEVHKSRAAN